MYDLIVIGGGSAGMPAARIASSYKKKVLLITNDKLGGTCVNLGCVPKKIMYNLVDTMENFETFDKYFDKRENKIDYKKFKIDRDNSIKRLNNIYKNLLDKNDVELIYGYAKVLESKNEIHRVSVNDKIFECKKILLATGSEPSILTNFKQFKSSDDFFYLEKVPKNAIIVGTGYIAIEISFILAALGTKVVVIGRNNILLSHLDNLFGKNVQNEMEKRGILIKFNDGIEKVENFEKSDEIFMNSIGKNSKKKYDVPMKVILKSGEVFNDVDFIMNSTGRICNTDYIQMEIEKEKSYLKVDKNFMTSIPNIYATGDLLGPPFMLTPYAIHCSRALVHYLFGNKPIPDRINEFVPSVVFSHPPCATVGLTEKEARREYGDDIEVIESSFVNLFYTLLPPEEKPKSVFKMICYKEKVIGVHLFGKGVDEMIQGVAIALKKGVTKKDFSDVVGVHPTGSEEIVFMARDK